MEEELIIRLRQAFHAIARQLNTTTTVEGLTPSQASALGLVATRGPMVVADLAKLEALNPSMTSRVVRQLLHLELIRRIPHSKDGRTALLSITSKGRAVHRRIRSRRLSVLSECFDAMNPQQVSDLLTALPALEATVEQLTTQNRREPLGR